jgi:hypothetical protein
MITATTFGVGQVVYSILWFFLFFIEIWLEISIFIDIFRSHDLAGWQKALWVLLVLLLPIVGIFAYFIARGNKMRAHQIEAQQAQQASGWPGHYGHRLAEGGETPTQELSRLADLKRDGMISDDEYEVLKSHIMQRASDANNP